jgi:outer membrane protein, heavy metal efflux system
VHSARNTLLIMGLGIFAMAGCHSAVQQNTDALVRDRAAKPMDVSDFLVPAKKPQEPPPIDPKTPPMVKNLQVPAGTPGIEAPAIIPPKDFYKLPEKEKQAFLTKYFKLQLEVGDDPQPVPGPDGRPLSLADLQKLAREHNPLLKQAASDIDNFDGARIQAAVYNNPTFNYSSSPVSFTSGNVAGPGISQTIVTMGKKKLAEAAAIMDIANAKLAYRRAETDLMAAVRSNYFQVLVNEEGMKANRALMVLTDQIYKLMLDQLKGGYVAAYEPAQLGVFAGQARMAYLTSRHNYLQSWKMLAASIGLTTMPATQLSGSIAGELPRFDFEKSLAHVLKNHTDAQTANNGVDKARLLLRLQEVQAIPDVTVGASIYDDNSSPGPPRFVPTLSLSVPVPVFDRNQGNIKSAQAALVRAVEQPHATQNALTQLLADAYRRLEENRMFLDLYRKQLLPQQIQAYRATVERHYGIGSVEVNPAAGAATAYMSDLITAEQNLVSLIASYLSTLSNYWQAVSDTASLLQIDDAYLMAKDVEKMPGADLAELLSLPCCHPCSSLKLGAPTAQPTSRPVGPAQLPDLAAQRQNSSASVAQAAAVAQPMGLSVEVQPTEPEFRLPTLLPPDSDAASKGETR